MHGLIDNYQLTVPAILRRAATVFADRPVVSRTADGSMHRYTYQDMAVRAYRLGHALRNLGIGPGDRVATLAWNHHRHLEAYFAIPSSRCIPSAENRLRWPQSDNPSFSDSFFRQRF
jgi:fatty-acyl-CoA synthase